MPSNDVVEVTIPFDTGTDATGDDKLGRLAPGGPIKNMENLRLERDGRIVQRPAWEILEPQLLTSSALPSFTGLVQMDSQLCAIGRRDGGALNAGLWDSVFRREISGKWTCEDPNSSITREKTSVLHDVEHCQGAVTSGDCCIPQSFTLGSQIWTLVPQQKSLNGSVYAVIVHDQSGVLLAQSEFDLSNVGTGICAVASATAFFVFSQNGTALHCRRLTLSATLGITSSFAGNLAGATLTGGSTVQPIALSAQFVPGSSTEIMVAAGMWPGLSCIKVVVTSPTAIAATQQSTSFPTNNYKAVDLAMPAVGNCVGVIGVNRATQAVDMLRFSYIASTLGISGNLPGFATAIIATNNVTPVILSPTSSFSTSEILCASLSLGGVCIIQRYSLAGAAPVLAASTAATWFALPVGPPFEFQPGDYLMPCITGFTLQGTTVAPGSEQRFSVLRFGLNISPRYELSIDPFVASSGSFPADTGTVLQPPGRWARLASDYFFPHLRKNGRDSNSFVLTRAQLFSTRYSVPIAVDSGVFIPGALPMYFDGSQTAEASFIGRPIVISVTQGGGGSGSLTASSTYSYQSVWSAIDSRGRTVYSPVSLPGLFTTPAASVEEVLFVTGPLTYRRQTNFAGVQTGISGDPRTEAYRTIANGGTLFFERSTIDPLSILGNTSSLILEDTDAVISGSATFESQAGRRLMYVGTSTSVETGAPEPCELAIVADNRLWTAKLPDRRRIQCSKPFTPGEPISWAGPGSALYENFFVQFPENVTAIQTLDEKLYVETIAGFYLVTGLGPDRNGNGSYDPPIRLPGSIGSINPNKRGTLLKTAHGLLSEFGGRVELVGRGGQSPEWVGEAIKDQWGSGSLDTGTVMPNLNEAWLIQDGYAYCWDLSRKIWSRNQIQDPDEGQVEITSAIEFDGTIYATTVNGRLLVESGSLCSSGILVTKSLAVGDIMNWSQVKEVTLLGTFLAAGTITLQVSYDDGATFSTPLNKSLTLLDYAPGKPFQLKWTLQQQKCDRIMLRFTIGSGPRCAHFHAVRLKGTPETGIVRAGPRSDG
jgi:hypothetical protein